MQGGDMAIKSEPITARSLRRLKEHLDRRLDRLFELALQNQAMLREISNDVEKMQVYIGCLTNSFAVYEIRNGMKDNN